MKKCYNIDCSDNWKSKQKKIIDSVNGCECELNDCLSCDSFNFGENKRICTICNDNFYRIENDSPYYENYFECFKKVNGYYIDTNDKLFKKCFDTCETCEIKGDNSTHNCLTCKNNFPNGINYNDYKNCYEECTYYYYFDNEHTYYCTINSSCPKEYPKLLLDERKCIKDFSIIEDIKIDEKEDSRKEEIKYYDKILETIEDVFTSNDFDTSDLDKGEDQVIDTEKIKITLTTVQNQKDNINSDKTTIDLGDCEASLRQSYNLTDNETIYIKMLEVTQEEMRIPKVEYDVYAKINGENLTKLDLTYCQNNKISISIPINNVDNLDKLNKSSSYYNDLCYTATSDSGTDITLKDRKNEYPSIAVCQDDCDFVDYNYTTKKAKCSCEAKKSSKSFVDMKINKKKILDNFKNIKNIVNLNLLKCAKVLFTKIGISENVGFYIILAIIIFHTIILILFYLKKLDLLKAKIKYIIFAIKNLKLKKDYEKEKVKEEEKNPEKLQINSKRKQDREIDDLLSRLNIMNNTSIKNNNNRNKIITIYSGIF